MLSSERQFRIVIWGIALSGFGLIAAVAWLLYSIESNMADLRGELTGVKVSLAEAESQLSRTPPWERREGDTVASGGARATPPPTSTPPPAELPTSGIQKERVVEASQWDTICDRTPRMQRALFEALQANVKLCAVITVQELKRVERLEIAGPFAEGDFANLENLATLTITGRDLPIGLFETLLPNLKVLSINLGRDGPHDNGIYKTLPPLDNLPALELLALESYVHVEELGDADFAGAPTLREIYLDSVGTITGNPFAGLHDLEHVAIDMEDGGVYPVTLFQDSPQVRQWDIRRDVHEALPLDDMEQLCRVHWESNQGGYDERGYEIVADFMVDGRYVEVAGEAWSPAGAKSCDIVAREKLGDDITASDIYTVWGNWPEDDNAGAE